MTHLYLIRHADALEAEKDGKYGVDMGLSRDGIEQAMKLRDRLQRTGEIKADVFMCSPLRRAQETAGIIAPALGLEIDLDEDLEEWRAADETMHPDEFMAQWERLTPAQKPYYHWVEGDENRMQFALRVNLTLNRILDEHAGKTIVVLSHGAFIQLSFQYFFGYGEAAMDRAVFEVRKTSITHWFRPGDQTRWTLERANDYWHLM